MAILFKPRMIEAIKAGRKSVTRREVKPGETANVKTSMRMLDIEGVFVTEKDLVLTRNIIRKVQVLDRVLTAKGRTKWAVGQRHAIRPGMYAPGMGHLVIATLAEDETVEDITEAEALAEGFESVNDFLDYWRLLNGKKFKPVWVIGFDPAGVTWL